MRRLFSLVESYFADFSRLKLFLLVFLFSLIAILLSLKLGGFAATAVVLIPALLSILQITKGVWSPEGGSKSKVGLVSLGVALLAISSSRTWRPFIESLLSPLLSSYPSLKDRLPHDSSSILGLLFLSVVILIVNYFARDTTAMKEHPTPLEKEFPEKDYKHHRRSFCGVLLDDLNRIDRETNWSAEIFTPLDAEVEVQSGTKGSKRIADLLGAIRRDRRSKVFLVLGDPGSGKSVALRKLCGELLREVEATGRVPVYVNLREWEPSRVWSESAPPTVEELYGFIFENLKSRGDIFTKEFLDKYFKKMFENGRLFIVLDSFDEIPAVLDVDERSWLIHKLSEVIYRFLAGAHESRGVLASRIFRRPTRSFDAKTTLVIRPFTEVKIVETLRKSLSYDESLVKLLFNERQEFIPIARNPFTAALISSYAKQHNNTLPPTQSELYSSYINNRLIACNDKIRSKGLTVERVIHSSINIAYVMLRTEALGLEAAIEHLQWILPGEPVQDVVDILRYARLGRLGAGDEKRFSFVHRRFNEYFVVQELKKSPGTVPIDAIPTDSRWRDALVLYCEIADSDHARVIAESCAREVKCLSAAELNMAGAQYLRSVHSLRFLKDAFRSRPKLLGAFRGELASAIRTELLSGSNLLSKKIAVEAVGLLKPKQIDDVLSLALGINNRWLNEIAFKSCHYLARLSPYLSRKLVLHIEKIETWSFVKRRRELMLSFTLSNVFSHLKWFCYSRMIDISCVLLAICILSVLTRGLFLAFVLLVVLCHRLAREFVAVADIRNIIGVCVIPFTIFLPIAVSARLTGGKRNVALVTFLLLVGLLLFIPWYRIWHWFKERKRDLSVRRVRKLRRYFSDTDLWIGLLVILGAFIVITLLFLGVSLFPRIGLTILALAVLTALIAGILYLLRRFREFWRDKRRIFAAVRGDIANRQQIENQFSEFETSGGRLRFVRHLDALKFSPIGSWRTGVLPNVDDDEASTLLAQLEEKWLGLDR